MLSFIILIMIFLTIKKWLPVVLFSIGVLIAFPAIPFIIAHNIKETKPNTAMALRVLWTLNFIVVLIFIFIFS